MAGRSLRIWLGVGLIALALTASCGGATPTPTLTASQEIMAELEQMAAEPGPRMERPFGAAAFDALLLGDADRIEACVEDTRAHAPADLLEVQDVLAIGDFARMAGDVGYLIKTSELRELCRDYVMLLNLPASTQWVLENWELDNVTECAQRKYLFRHC